MTLVGKARMFMLVLSAFAVLMVATAVPAAAVTAAVTDFNPDGATVRTNTELTVFGIDLNGDCALGNPCTLQNVRASFSQVGSDTAFDLSDLQAGADGIRIYKDTSRTGANEDTLDAGDNEVSDGYSASGLNVTIAVNTSVPAAAQGAYTFFMVVATSDTIANGDDFTITLPSNAFDVNPNPLLGFFGGATSSVIAADTAPPVVTSTSTPASEMGDVAWVFNEQVFGVDEEGTIILEEAETGDEILGTISYEANNRRAIFDPLGPLEKAVAYVATLAPEGAPPITDAAGNEVATSTLTFMLLPTRFTPGVVSGNTWQLNNGFDQFTDTSFAYGKATDVKLAGDWDGDGKYSGVAVRGNLWYFNNAHDGTHDFSLAFGRTTDKKIVGDWDGDGVTTPGIIRGNLWYLSNDFDPFGEIIINYGRSTDKHVAGDWDGDGTWTPGIVRGNIWYLSNNFDSAADIPTFSMGRSSDIPLAADWTGEGIFTPAVFRGGQWFINTGFDPVAETSFFYGSSSVSPLAGDWDAGAS